MASSIDAKRGLVTRGGSAPNLSGFSSVSCAMARTV